MVRSKIFRDFENGFLETAYRIIFGKNVNRLRQTRGLTQEKLAELVEVDRRHIQRIENGSANAGIEVICRMRIALAASWEDLMDGRK